MYYAPLNYTQINIASGTYNPSTVKNLNNDAVSFWERALFQRAISIIDFENLPFDGAVKDFFQYCLYTFGFVGFFDDDKFGLSFQPGTLSGFDLYYQPVRFLVANPLLNREFNIGKNCEILKLTPDYFGIVDVITYYACKLAQLDNAIDMSLINSKLAYIVGAKNDAAAKALKKIFDAINEGNPTAVYDQALLVPNDPDDKKEPWQLWDRHVKESYITTDLLRDFQTILNNYDCEVGIPTIPYEKKERMVTSEAESRQLDAISRSTVWLNTLNDSFSKVNAMFGTNMSAKLHYDELKNEQKGGSEDGEDNTV